MRFARFNVTALCLVLMAALATPSALASARLSIAGVGNLPMPRTSTTNPESKGEFGFGGAGLFGIQMGKMFELEFGAMYFQRKFKNTYNNLSILGQTINGVEKQSVNVLALPILFKIWFNPFINIGAGAYYGTAVGKVKFDRTGYTINGTAQGVTETDISGSNSDYGLVGSLGFHIPFGPKWGLMANGRYLYGLKDVAGTKNADVQALLGLTFLIGGGR